MKETIRKHKDTGKGGIYSICSAHPTIIEAAFLFESKTDNKILIEATSNQVNQFGGYTGMKPTDFIGFVKNIAKKTHFDENRIIFGGDHLGPNCWVNDPPEIAMKKSLELIKQYVEAGFTKIHLDASMPCYGEPAVLSPEIIAQRAAQMCKQAELSNKKINSNKLCYIIGTEVPIPGGEANDLQSIHVSKLEDIKNTIDLHIKEFNHQGIDDFDDKVIGVVVHPGVEFDHSKVFEYNNNETKAISEFIKSTPWVYEAHSTDYQTKEKLKQLVNDSFAILKVGPGLTFAYREAIISLAMIEDFIIPENKKSQFIPILKNQLLNNPKYWDKYYKGNFDTINQQLFFSLSDRIRYYWTDEIINNALSKLLMNLNNVEIPLSLVSQFFPNQYQLIKAHAINNTAEEIIISKVQDVLSDYSYGCAYE
ncbi:class II D-tagatose-bisphosphate aldolase, non-catalytic subunit [Thorsellia kenyensis]|uniref:Class II D-tagatose-bisphosphate aldolase, non-catalytic subunit n=1 Tax=Thorsellia kenyensis TaxID=1549888 RepID=A0ABV6CB45_9GAMM